MSKLLVSEKHGVVTSSYERRKGTKLKKYVIFMIYPGLFQSEL
jgi:hypothetical protein